MSLAGLLEPLETSLTREVASVSADLLVAGIVAAAAAPPLTPAAAGRTCGTRRAHTKCELEHTATPPAERREESSSMDDKAATFDAHVEAEFQDLDLEAPMPTTTDDPNVHHVPTTAGGNRVGGVRDLYGHHLIGR